PHLLGAGVSRRRSLPGEQYARASAARTGRPAAAVRHGASAVSARTERASDPGLLVRDTPHAPAWLPEGRPLADAALRLPVLRRQLHGLGAARSAGQLDRARARAERGRARPDAGRAAARRLAPAAGAGRVDRSLWGPSCGPGGAAADAGASAARLAVGGW